MRNNWKMLKLILNCFVVISVLIVIWKPARGKSNQLLQKGISKSDTIKVIVPNKDKDFFYVELKNTLKAEQSTYDSASKIIAISDIEGNFNGLYSFLISNNVIDKNYNWIFGNGHVVFLGDFVDRGSQSAQVLWLIYKLEGEAMSHGGKVHYILGNHEVVNIEEVGYGENKYIQGDQDSSANIPFDESNRVLFSAKSEIGKWLRTKNSIEKIGKYTFVHGGISPRLISFKPDFDKINNTIRENIENDLYTKPQKNKLANFLIGKEGPLWYRGLAINYKYYNKVNKSEYKRIRIYFNSPKIVIGHTPVEDIQTDFGGSLIKIDIAHGQEKFSGKTKGLLIENNIEFKVDDKGNRSKL